jgi:predicted HicB family RNase H-like nuclease
MNKSKTVILRVEPELKARLIAEAERQGITLSKHIRQILIAASRKRE